jgi:hypothetical protein
VQFLDGGKREMGEADNQNGPFIWDVETIGPREVERFGWLAGSWK